MNRFLYIHLHNFQGYDDVRIDLSPRINVLIGETDQGKSSIARAIYWVVKNYPLGIEYIRNKTKMCFVEIGTTKGVVRRIRSRSGINKYVVNGTDEYAALRSNVPEEVQEILGLTDTNIQMQHDPPFLLDMNGGEVARKLNTVIGVNEIDSSLKFINSHIRSQSSKAKHIKTEIASRRKKLRKYRKLNKIKELHNIYKEEKKKKKKLTLEIEQLSEIIYKLEQSEEIIHHLELLASAKDLIKQINDQKEILEETETECCLLEDLFESMQVGLYVDDHTEIIDAADKIVQTFYSKMESLNKVQKEHESLLEIIEILTESQSELEILETKLEQSEQELNDFSVCPLCETVLE